MRIYNYNKERKIKSKSNIYIKFIIFGIIVAIVFIGGLKVLVAIIKFLIKALAKYWIWFIVGFFIFIFLIRFLKNRRRRKDEK